SSPKSSVIYAVVSLFRPDGSVICTLSLHDALPILRATERARHVAHLPKVLCHRLSREPSNGAASRASANARAAIADALARVGRGDRKSTRLNSSHEWISYAVFCLK